jgi:hypothetical protein
MERFCTFPHQDFFDYSDGNVRHANSEIMENAHRTSLVRHQGAKMAIRQVIYAKHALHGLQGPLPSGGSGSSNVVTKRWRSNVW